VAYDSKTVQKLRLTANVVLQSRRKGTGRPYGEGAFAVTPQAAACQVLIQVHAMHFNLESPSVCQLNGSVRVTDRLVTESTNQTLRTKAWFVISSLSSEHRYSGLFQIIHLSKLPLTCSSVTVN
jgi:hypothetical protein